MLHNLNYFHPGCEISIANALPNFNLPALIQKFEQDLSLLPSFFNENIDFTLVDREPSESFKEYLFAITGKKSRFVSFKGLENFKEGHFLLNSWCYSPHLYEKFKKYRQVVIKENYHSQNLRIFQSKTYALVVCKELYRHFQDFYLFEENLGQKCTTIEEVYNKINDLKSCVLKAPISSSGRGNLFLREPNLRSYQKQWIASFINKQKELIVEPFHDKILDLAAEFKFSDGKITFLGFSFFKTNSNGFYLSNYLNFSLSDFEKRFPDIHLMKWVNSLKVALANANYLKTYRGFLGVDAMLVKTERNEIKLHPCLEINARYTMGMLALKIQNYISEESKGEMKIFYEKGQSFGYFSNKMLRKYPQEWKREKPFKGFFPLVEPLKNKQFGSYVLLD